MVIQQTGCFHHVLLSSGSYSHSLTVGHTVPGLSGLGGLAGLGPPGAALTGGPARGWYPQRSKPRPLSSEHLDRLQQVGTTHIRGVGPLAWSADTHRKPQTLPPNLSPKFFHRSPREALRRVTSLLIRKGTTSTQKHSTQVNGETRRKPWK